MAVKFALFACDRTCVRSLPGSSYSSHCSKKMSRQGSNYGNSSRIYCKAAWWKFSEYSSFRYAYMGGSIPKTFSLLLGPFACVGSPPLPKSQCLDLMKRKYNSSNTNIDLAGKIPQTDNSPNNTT